MGSLLIPTLEKGGPPPVYHNNNMKCASGVIILLGAIQGLLALKCEVGLNNETQAMECTGSWESVQNTMKTKLGAKFDQIKSNLTSDMTGIVGFLKEHWEKAKDALGEAGNALQNAISPSERRRRAVEAEDENELIRVRRADNTGAEPEPEGEEYYCIKKSMAGNTVKSCLPKSIADPLKMACGTLASAGTVCVCNDEDMCNTAPICSPPMSLLWIMLLPLVSRLV